jgi:hypothetical protein
MMVQKRCACGWGIFDADDLCAMCKCRRYIAKRVGKAEKSVEQSRIAEWL